MLENGLKSSLLRGLEVTATAYAKGDIPSTETLATLVGKRTRLSSRLRSVVLLTSKIIPSLPESFARVFEDTSRFPVKEKKSWLVNFGHEQTVYAVDEEPSTVLKIVKPSLGLPIDKLVPLATEIKSRHEGIKDLYKSVPDFVVDEKYTIVHSHMRGVPAIGVFQDYVSGDLTDFFDFSIDQLTDLCRENEFFKRQFMLFAPQFLDHFNRRGLAIDIGSGNLAVMKSGVRVHLKLMDAHTICDINDYEKRQDTLAVSILRGKAQFIEDVLSEVTDEQELLSVTAA